MVRCGPDAYKAFLANLAFVSVGILLQNYGTYLNAHDHRLRPMHITQNQE